MEKSDIVIMLLVTALFFWFILFAFNQNEKRCQHYGKYYAKKTQWNISLGCEIEKSPGVFVSIADWIRDEDVK